jgi:glycosyltransferase involved in cell wall biosynthesis
LSALIARGRSPLVVTYHADIFRQRALLFAYKPLVLKCLREADAVIVASERMRQKSPLIRQARIDPHVISYGIDPDRWSKDRVDQAKIAELHRRFGEQFILSVGRLVPYKGLNWLVDAAQQLNAPVVIVGEGISRPALEAQIAALGLQGRVHLVGGVDDDWLAAYFAAASVFVLPSWNRAEAFGIVVLEAQAAGLPVVVTDVGTGTVEAFEPGETGIVIPPRNVPALVRAVNGLLADPATASRMGEAGRLRVGARNSLDSLARSLRPLYESVSRPRV